VNSAEITPDAVLLPMNGWDAKGYRLGYGGGFFDRTLASLSPRPVTVGVSFTHGFLPLLRAGEVDKPLDAMLTEDGVMYEDRSR
jgi:5,10-methenyltetrahydrofolate synthetase